MKLTKLLSVTCFFLVALASLHAHNGGSVVAKPINGITVDGDLGDWPDHLAVYQPEHADYGDKPLNAGDLEVSFQLGYDAKARTLFVAVEVADESAVLDPNAGKAWDTQDGCSLYIDRLHAKGVSTPVQYFQCGDQLQVHGTKSDKVDAACRIRRSDNKIIYEWGIPLGETFKPGRSLGFDLDVTDKDADGSFTWIAWTPGTRKAYYAANIGDVFLLEEGVEMGTVSGRVIWPEANRDAGARSLIALQSETNPMLRVESQCDATGQFHVELPAGRYIANPVDTIGARVVEADHVHFEVQPNEHIETTPLVARSLPKPDLAGEEGVLHLEDFNTREIDRFVRIGMAYHKIPGISLAIVKDAKIAYTQMYGVENAATGKALCELSVFEACSLTKPVFGFAVSRLVERGVLDWDTPLDTYLPNAQGYADACTDQDRYRQITARHVLAHRTGFPNWRDSKELPITFEPGKGYGYSGEGFELLGAVVSHLTKKGLAEVIEEEVFEPLGIENAHLVWSDTLGERVGNGHTNGKHPIPKSKTHYPGMAHSLHINAPNYAKFMTAILHRQAMSKPTYDEMLRTQYEMTDSDDANALPFGLGLVSEDTKFGKKYWHGGSNPGWKCLFAIYDELKMGYVVFTNSDEGQEFARELERYLVTGKSAEESG